MSTSEENRPSGTTWIFSDGSQVVASASIADDSINEEEDKDGKRDIHFLVFFPEILSGVILVIVDLIISNALFINILSVLSVL